MDVPKKWWWVVGIAVPIIVAVIAILPRFFSTPIEANKDRIYVNLVGTHFNGNVAFNDVSVIAEQVRQTLGKELPENVVLTLEQAIKFVQSKKFDEAIPLLQSAAKAAPVPALFNNLEAAYLATTDSKRAERYFSEADVAAIRGQLQAGHRAWQSRDWAALATLYTEDALVMPEDAPIVQGREHIVAWNSQFAVKITDSKFDVLEIEGSDGVAYATCRHSYNFKLKDHPEILSFQGKHVLIVKKQTDGSWLTAVQIWNSDSQ